MFDSDVNGADPENALSSNHRLGNRTVLVVKFLNTATHTKEREKDFSRKGMFRMVVSQSVEDFLRLSS